MAGGLVHPKAGPRTAQQKDPNQTAAEGTAASGREPGGSRKVWAARKPAAIAMQASRSVQAGRNGVSQAIDDVARWRPRRRNLRVDRVDV